MILTDYFRSAPDRQWDLAQQLGVRHAVVRLPDDPAFDITDRAQIQHVMGRFTARGIQPIVVEPMPNCVHDHIKRGDAQRDESLEKVCRMIPLLRECGVHTICANFMAEIGWLRTSRDHPERGGARTTEFDMRDFRPGNEAAITSEQLWKNLEIFLQAVLPAAEKYDMRIALHPDDPPVEKLGRVERILISKANVQRALDMGNSPALGVTFCQANYVAMGEDVYECIRDFGRQGKLFFVHFRDIIGNKEHFYETFHDNGCTDMAKALRCYRDAGFDGPIRVDHVPTMAGEETDMPGYAELGRLYAIGYLRGLAEASGIKLI